jgi:hypothetical protein
VATPVPATPGRTSGVGNVVALPSAARAVRTGGADAIRHRSCRPRAPDVREWSAPDSSGMRAVERDTRRSRSSAAILSTISHRPARAASISASASAVSMTSRSSIEQPSCASPSSRSVSVSRSSFRPRKGQRELSLRILCGADGTRMLGRGHDPARKWLGSTRTGRGRSVRIVRLRARPCRGPDAWGRMGAVGRGGGRWRRPLRAWGRRRARPGAGARARGRGGEVGPRGADRRGAESARGPTTDGGRRPAAFQAAERASLTRCACLQKRL